MTLDDFDDLPGCSRRTAPAITTALQALARAGAVAMDRLASLRGPAELLADLGRRARW